MIARHTIEYGPDADFMQAAGAAYILARAMFPDHELIQREISESVNPFGYSTRYTINVRDDAGKHVGNVQTLECGTPHRILRMKAHGPSPALYGYQAGVPKSIITTVYF